MNTPNTSRRASQPLTTSRGSRQTPEDNVQMRRASRGSTKWKSRQHTQSNNQPGPLNTQTVQPHTQLTVKQALDINRRPEGCLSRCKGQPRRGKGTGLTATHSSHSTALQERQCTPEWSSNKSYRTSQCLPFRSPCLLLNLAL